MSSPKVNVTIVPSPNLLLTSIFIFKISVLKSLNNPLAPNVQIDIKKTIIAFLNGTPFALFYEIIL